MTQPHPTHSFHTVDDEGIRCLDCDIRKTRVEAAEPCPEFVRRAREVVREAAFLLFMSTPIAPSPAGADASYAECRAAIEGGAEWALDASLRGTTCRTLAQLLGVLVEPDASLIAMTRT